MKDRCLALRSTLLLALFAVPACDFTVGPTNLDMRAAEKDMLQPSRFGVIRATGTTTGSTANAFFLDMQQTAGGCVHRAIGECVLYSCAGTAFTAPNPGILTIGGGTPTVTLTPRNDGSYIPYSASGSVTFLAGQKLLFDAPGATVPLLHGELTPPNVPFSLTNPDGSRSSIVFTLNRQRDFRLTWSALAAGTRVHAELSQDTDSNRLTLLQCDFDGMAGAGTMPTQLLTVFALTNPGDLSHTGTLTVGPSTSTNLHPGDWDIATFAMANGREGYANITDN